MKYFLCAIDNICLGIPQDNSAHIISSSAIEDNDLIISLPQLMNCPNILTPHGIVLKPVNSNRKTILLTPPIDIEIDIPDEDIHDTPRAIAKILPFCNGACFIKYTNGENLIFTLDIMKIMGAYA